MCLFTVFYVFYGWFFVLVILYVLLLFCVCCLPFFLLICSFNKLRCLLWFPIAVIVHLFVVCVCVCCSQLI